MGTLAFARALMGLLGMDCYQDELTDRVFGDLFVAGKLIKLADNMYFGGDYVEELQEVFETILQNVVNLIFV